MDHSSHLLPDYLIVGAGLTGATIANLLKQLGHSVLVLESRKKIGGNVRDSLHVSGIRYHCYGPHYFRTNSPKIWNFVNSFSKFYAFEAVVKSQIGNKLYQWPPSIESVTEFIGRSWKPGFKGQPKNFEQAVLRFLPTEFYAKFVKEYTEKQWGVDPAQLSSDLAKRFDLRDSADKRLSNKARFQGLPLGGYSLLIKRMLAGIPVETGINYLSERAAVSAKKRIIFSGSIDNFFNYELGRLKYRGQRRDQRLVPSVDFVQGSCQVNYPGHSSGESIRSIEWKHLLPVEKQKLFSDSLLTFETPIEARSVEECEYPFPSSEQRALFLRYKKLAKNCPEVLFAGRLGEYKYYDMDQAIARAFTIVQHLICGRSLE